MIARDMMSTNRSIAALCSTGETSCWPDKSRPMIGNRLGTLIRRLWPGGLLRSNVEAPSVRRSRSQARILGFSACRQASAAVEFAMVAPIFFLVTIATFELSLYLFLSGSVQSSVMMASRYGVTGQQAGLVDRQQRIINIVSERSWGLVTIQPEDITTLVYESFSDIGKPEPFGDTNGNGDYDAGSEAFTDVNGNGVWDNDMGAAGLGGPGDIVLYKVEFSTDVLTNIVQPVFGDEFNYIASVAVRNEPY